MRNHKTIIMKKTISIALLAIFSITGNILAQDKKTTEQKEKTEVVIRESIKELSENYKLSQSQQSAVKQLLDYKYNSTDSKENIKKTLEGRFQALLGEQYAKFSKNEALFKKIME